MSRPAHLDQVGPDAMWPTEHHNSDTAGRVHGLNDEDRASEDGMEVSNRAEPGIKLIHAVRGTAV